MSPIRRPSDLKQWALPLCALGALLLAGCAAEVESRRAADVFRDRFTDGSGQGPEMVVLPPGASVYGDPIVTNTYTTPPRPTVQIGYRLAVGRYEVTFAEWDACGLDGGCNNYRPDDLGWGRGNRPVMNVSWNDAQAYVEWLNRKTGLTGRADRYRLPSEAEWEYAARAGTSTAFSFGDDEGQLGQHAWFNGNSNRQTHPVGGKRANAFGLHDMHGNVREWVEDCWNESHSGAPSDGSARTFVNCSNRVSRGGSWGGNPQDLRSANRIRNSSGFRYFIFGFRLARMLPD